jgi:aryl sulfotransferase
VFRPGDVVISTPPKCGTTWMQTVVGMLVLGRVDLGAPISTISPWLDSVVHSDAEVFALLEQQDHRRFVKTHTPLDGVPRLREVTYITVMRHPLDAALSHRDHRSNSDRERMIELRSGVGDSHTGTATSDAPPSDPADYLRSFINSDSYRAASGQYALADHCEQARAAWGARHAPNVHLFHYADMWNDLDSEMRQVARALDVDVDEQRFREFVEAASLQSMRSRAADTAPEAHLGVWREPDQFFKSGGTRAWGSLLGPDDLAHFDRQLADLAGDAAGWTVGGRQFLD